VFDLTGLFVIIYVIVYSQLLQYVKTKLTVWSILHDLFWQS